MDKINELALKLDNNAQIINLLSRAVEIVTETSRFQIYVEQLISKQKKLVALNALLCQDITPNKDKLDSRKELADITFQVIRIIQAFAFNKKKINLQKRLKSFTSEYIQSCSDKELIIISKKIWLIANKYGGATTTPSRKRKYPVNSDNSTVNINFEKEYGLSPSIIKNLDEAKIRFIGSITSSKNDLKEKEKVARRIKFLLKQTEKLLTNKIDHILLLYKTEKPNFYQEYRWLRDNQIHEPVVGNMD